MDVPFLQVEAAGQGAVAHAFGQKTEGQQDCVGQRQTSPAGHPSPGVRGLQQVCNRLRREQISKSKITFKHVTWAESSSKDVGGHG